MDSEELEKYMRAGEIAFEAKKLAERIVKPGTPILKIAEEIEGLIRSRGAAPAFPTNISINHVAAHRTPYVGDTELVPEGAVVKVDIGVHVDGYIADTAITIVLDDRFEPLAEAVKNALHKALKRVRAGARFRDIGFIIEREIKAAGFKPIKNLSGHSLGRYQIHGGEYIPNYRDALAIGRFRSGRAYAIEPFGTNGRGYVVEDRSSIQIYALRSGRGSVSGFEAEVLNVIRSRFSTLPFCERWLVDLGDIDAVRAALKRLVVKKILTQYPVLIEAGKGMVAQFEETIYVTSSGAYITTNPEIKTQ